MGHLSDTLRCQRCGDVIGVYEPLIVLVGGLPRQTSRAREPDAGSSGADCYHQACYANGRDEDAPRPF